MTQDEYDRRIKEIYAEYDRRMASAQKFYCQLTARETDKIELWLERQIDALDKIFMSNT